MTYYDNDFSQTQYVRDENGLENLYHFIFY